jgi:XTP/dITP diphosphohydrolase
MTDKPLLVLGTTNRDKGRELAELFGSAGIELTTLAEFPSALDVEETGDTFAANAALKATVQARHLEHWVLAEDSGLVVDALDGAPGVFSARYSGPQSTPETNNRRLLDELGGTPLDQRTARYVCHLTVSDPSGTIRAEREAYCAGRIALELRGRHGFAYDPLFEIVEYHRTLGELGPVVKAALSHRSRAARQLLPLVAELFR